MGLFASSSPSSGAKHPSNSPQPADKMAQMSQMNKEWQSLQMMAKQAKDRKF